MRGHPLYLAKVSMKHIGIASKTATGIIELCLWYRRASFFCEISTKFFLSLLRKHSGIEAGYRQLACPKLQALRKALVQ